MTLYFTATAAREPHSRMTLNGFAFVSFLLQRGSSKGRLVPMAIVWLGHIARAHQ